MSLCDDIEVVRGSGLFDSTYYLGHNPDVAELELDPVEHFCEEGWRQLRSPRPGFDVWWYWVKHLDPALDDVNPLVHYANEGQARGLPTRPTPWQGEGHRLPAGEPVRRVCLFAGHDRDGVVDDYVVAYVRELSRFADVYYLADCALDPGELDKLAGITKGAWAIRHGAYDFGSYSMLARELVGWEAIDDCDELLLVNDSCYLLRPLDHVFAQMDTTACDWWGLQATKGIAMTSEVASNTFTEPRPMVEVMEDLAAFEEDYLYDFHVGSYFLAYRRPVLDDTGFRAQLHAVQGGQGKLQIIQKYEIGFTHYLLGEGHRLATYVDELKPFHPLFAATHFDLIAHGFPLLKKYFVYQNHYDTPDLVAWKERVLELVPEAPVEMFERNLLRAAPDDRLQRSFAITTAPDGTIHVPTLLTEQEFLQEDRLTPTFDHWWAFTACAYDHTFAGNDRAVFEHVREDPSIKKIVLTRARRIEAEGPNVVVVPLASPEGQHYLLRSGQVFVKHSPVINVPYPLSPHTHNFINLWHGIPLKRFGLAAVTGTKLRERLLPHHEPCRAVITSSHIDSLAMVSAFHPLTLDRMWPTGLPRNDFILTDPDRLPPDLREEEQRLRELTGGRRLVLFVPTFKDGQAEAYYHFDATQIDWLTDWCTRNNAVLGVRDHMADTARTHTTMLAPTGALNLSSRHFPNVEVLYRVGAALITDYSSSLIDFLLTGRPVISFAYDLDNYSTIERGLFYDLDNVIPGPVARDFTQLTTASHLPPTPNGGSTSNGAGSSSTTSTPTTPAASSPASRSSTRATKTRPTPTERRLEHSTRLRSSGPDTM